MPINVGFAMQSRLKLE